MFYHHTKFPMGNSLLFLLLELFYLQSLYYHIVVQDISFQKDLYH